MIPRAQYLRRCRIVNSTDSEPIKTCVEESTRAAFVADDGRDFPELNSSYTTEFSEDGRVIETRMRNSDDSEWVSRTGYDSSGNFLKHEWGNIGEPTTESVYTYDNQGRLLKITNSAKPENPVSFLYDDRGRKTKIEVSLPEDYRPNSADARSPFAAADSAPNLDGGGSATTFYDEQDRPTEVHVRDAQGELISRAFRTYDEDGRVFEEHMIWDHPEKMFPASVRADVLKAGVSIEEFRRQMMEVMGGHSGPSAITYTYDAQGHVTQTRRRILNQEHTIETTYNEHGDKAVEITRRMQIGGQNGQAQRSGLPAYSEVRYSYEYDDRANWTEETVSYRSSPDEAFVSSTGRRRQLTYY
jgi:hypothetical protein